MKKKKRKEKAITILKTIKIDLNFIDNLLYYL
jgi:hypothetical protein